VVIVLTGGELPAILQPVEIAGPGADLLSVDAGGASRILSIGAVFGVVTGTTTLRDLTLTGGSLGLGNGGALSIHTASTVLERLRVVGNGATFGGGIEFAPAPSPLPVPGGAAPSAWSSATPKSAPTSRPTPGAASTATCGATPRSSWSTRRSRETARGAGAASISTIRCRLLPVRASACGWSARRWRTTRRPRSAAVVAAVCSSSSPRTR